MAKKKATFEEALVELESAVGALENDEISLDQSVEEFSRGVKALKECRDALTKAEGKITKLLVGKNGEFIEKCLGITVDSLVGGE